MVYEINLAPGPQRLRVKLGASVYVMRLLWRVGGGWFLDILSTDGEPIIASLPLLPGRDMLEQHQHLGIGHLRCTVDGLADEAPGYDDLGGRCRLYWWPA